MQTRNVIFTDEMKAELLSQDLDESLGDHELLVETEYSVISAGTEGSSFSGLERQHPLVTDFSYPRPTGYANLGRVVKAGAARQSMVNTRVLSFANHATHVKVNAAHFAISVPDEADGPAIPYTRMAGVGITSVRASSVAMGDTVMVVGMGLVGNTAAQLFRMSGADVLVVDTAGDRLERARQCGVERTCNPAEEDLSKVVAEWTGGKGARIVVEAIGSPKAIEQSILLTARHGEVILVGSPRERVTMDVTPMLFQMHTTGMHVIGAHEWTFPIDEYQGARHVMTRNYDQIVQWIMDGSLKTEPLTTHVLSPTDCQQAYMGLHSKKDEYLGVVYDWSRL